MIGEKETYKYLGIIKVDTIKQIEMKEKKLKKRITQENEKTTRNQTIKHRFHQRNKHLSYSPCKILWIILEVDEGKLSKNGPKEQVNLWWYITRKLMTIHLRDDIDYMSRKAGEKGLAIFEVSMDASISLKNTRKCTNKDQLQQPKQTTQWSIE